MCGHKKPRGEKQTSARLPKTFGSLVGADATVDWDQKAAAAAIYHKMVKERALKRILRRRWLQLEQDGGGGVGWLRQWLEAAAGFGVSAI